MTACGRQTFRDFQKIKVVETKPVDIPAIVMEDISVVLSVPKHASDMFSLTGDSIVSVGDHVYRKAFNGHDELYIMGNDITREVNEAASSKCVKRHLSKVSGTVGKEVAPRYLLPDSIMIPLSMYRISLFEGKADESSRTLKVAVSKPSARIGYGSLLKSVDLMDVHYIGIV